MNFDTNINNYNREELINMFELPPNFDKNITLERVNPGISYIIDIS
jgi:hypothetical protein